MDDLKSGVSKLLSTPPLKVVDDLIRKHAADPHQALMLKAVEQGVDHVEEVFVTSLAN